MSTNIEFWERVHRALDERRDPLEDAGVQDAIAREPRLLDELFLLRARLDALPAARERVRFPRTAAAAVIAIALGIGAFRLLRATAVVEPDIVADTPHPSPPDDAIAAPSDAAPNVVTPSVALADPQVAIAKSEILDFQLSITTERPGERDTVVIDRYGTRRTREFVGDAFEHATLTTEVLTPRGR